MANYGMLERFGRFTRYNTIGTVKFSTGAVGALHYGATVPSGEGTSRLAIFGNNTKMLKANWNNSLTLIGEDKQEWMFEERGPKAWGHYQIDSHFVECILGGKKQKVTVEDAIKA